MNIKTSQFEERATKTHQHSNISITCTILQPYQMVTLKGPGSLRGHQTLGLR